MISIFTYYVARLSESLSLHLNFLLPRKPNRRRTQINNNLFWAYICQNRLIGQNYALKQMNVVNVYTANQIYLILI